MRLALRASHFLAIPFTFGLRLVARLVLALCGRGCVQLFGPYVGARHSASADVQLFGFNVDWWQVLCGQTRQAERATLGAASQKRRSETCRKNRFPLELVAGAKPVAKRRFRL